MIAYRDSWGAIMSWQASKWAVAASVPAIPETGSSRASAKLVLLVMAEAADARGTGVILGNAALAERTGLSTRGVVAAKRLLEQAGLIVSERRFRPTDGGRMSDLVRLAMGSVGANISPPPHADIAGGQVQVSHDPPANNDGPKCESRTPITVSEPTNEPEGEDTLAPRSRLPAEWKPPLGAYEFAAELGLTAAEVEAETAKFRERMRADGKSSADWTAEWRLWLRRASEWKAKHGRPVNVADPVKASTVVVHKPWTGPPELRAAIVAEMRYTRSGGDAWARGYLDRCEVLEEQKALRPANGHAFSVLDREVGHILLEMGWRLLPSNRAARSEASDAAA